MLNLAVLFQKPAMKLLSIAIFAFVLKAYNASETCQDMRVPEGKCAMLFDEEDCTGWSAEVSNGYSELSYRERNEAESIIVKPGCKFIGKICNYFFGGYNFASTCFIDY